jgi:2-polyprenyl-3-methyl-5-hydroxy-6-metoxy-1,4-benzoquinol methylase
MLIDTGKDGYDANTAFDERTDRALSGTDPRTYVRDVVLTGKGCHGLWNTFSRVYKELAARREYSVLDIGCGFGRVSPFLSMFDCKRYVGIDRVSARIAYATERYANGAVSFQEADALTFDGGQFDVVWCCTVMQHLVRPQKLQLIETVKRCLAPGGIAILLEARVIDGSPEAAEQYYRDTCPLHMVPFTLAELVTALQPLDVDHSRDNLIIVRNGE